MGLSDGEGLDWAQWLWLVFKGHCTRTFYTAVHTCATNYSQIWKIVLLIKAKCRKTEHLRNWVAKTVNLKISGSAYTF